MGADVNLLVLEDWNILDLVLFHRFGEFINKQEWIKTVKILIINGATFASRENAEIYLENEIYSYVWSQALNEIISEYRSKIDAFNAKQKKKIQFKNEEILKNILEIRTVLGEFDKNLSNNPSQQAAAE